MLLCIIPPYFWPISEILKELERQRRCSGRTEKTDGRTDEWNDDNTRRRRWWPRIKMSSIMKCSFYQFGNQLFIENFKKSLKMHYARFLAISFSYIIWRWSYSITYDTSLISVWLQWNTHTHTQKKNENSWAVFECAKFRCDCIWIL